MQTLADLRDGHDGLVPGSGSVKPNKHMIEAAPYDEFVYLLQGHIDVIDDEGCVETFKAGDSFLMPRGCKSLNKQCASSTWC
jgi:ethanolamine utilization protein EutQ (cupin superfamily)